jgi:hypothetical protein
MCLILDIRFVVNRVVFYVPLLEFNLPSFVKPSRERRRISRPCSRWPARAEQWAKVEADEANAI